MNGGQPFGICLVPAFRCLARLEVFAKAVDEGGRLIGYRPTMLHMQEFLEFNFILHESRDVGGN